MLRIENFRPYGGQMVDLLKRLVEVESPSGNKAALDQLGSLLKEELEARGAMVEVVEQEKAGNHLVARWIGARWGGAGTADRTETSKGAQFLLLCHMDTVYELGWLREHPLREEDGRLYGPGTLDMKSGIVLALTVMEVIKKSGVRDDLAVTALFTSDEEVGSHSSRRLIEALAQQSGLTLCLEAALANGALKTGRKGTGTIEIMTRGRAAHAGVNHAAGVNAIEELAHHILAAQRLTDFATGTTTSVGRVSGGGAINVVPDTARAVVDLRVAQPGEVDRVKAWVDGLHPVLKGAQVRAKLDLNRPPMPRDALMRACFDQAKAIGKRLGLALEEGSTGGASDANFVAALGRPVLDGLGAMGEGAHSEGEYVLVSSLAERAALLAGILTEWDFK